MNLSKNPGQRRLEILDFYFFSPVIHSIILDYLRFALVQRKWEASHKRVWNFKQQRKEPWVLNKFYVTPVLTWPWPCREERSASAVRLLQSSDGFIWACEFLIISFTLKKKYCIKIEHQATKGCSESTES